MNEARSCRSGGGPKPVSAYRRLAHTRMTYIKASAFLFLVSMMSHLLVLWFRDAGRPYPSKAVILQAVVFSCTWYMISRTQIVCAIFQAVARSVDGSALVDALHATISSFLSSPTLPLLSSHACLMPMGSLFVADYSL
eukprot:1404687-Rhodomonas_salina.3